MSARRLRIWAAVAILVAVGLWILQALIGLNYSDEGETYPWFLRAVQWLALALVLISLPLLFWALTRSRVREDA
jgi:uncharacterized membrane protein